MCLLLDAPTPAIFILVAGYILELARIWQPYYQGQQHTHIEIYVYSNGDHTLKYIDQSNIKQSVNRGYQVTITQRMPLLYSSCLPSNYYTKHNCHLILYIVIKFSLWINDFQYDEHA
jgi:tagatose-1,6-bisphosphate aldolase non-catalytic subunit AgaZ/GatZ